jgi:TrmH family RNA methyltransferase
MYISSASNSKVKLLVSLKKRAAREKTGLLFLEGERLVCDSARFGAQIVSIYIKEGYTGVMPLSDNTVTLSAALFDKIAETKTPQGIIAVAKMPLCGTCDVKGGAFLICDNVRDPGNLGAIIRTAHAFGASAVFLTKGCVDPYGPKTVRASMGSVFALPVLYAGINDIKRLKNKGVFIYSGVLAKNSVPLHTMPFGKNCAFLIGNEATGISDEMLEISDGFFTIPMPGGAESLNAAVAASVCLYEYLRRNIKEAKI